MLDGAPVLSARAWEDLRRPELLRLFQHYMVGYLPDPPGALRAVVELGGGLLFGGRASGREIALFVGPEGAPPIRLLLLVPQGRAGPVPVLLGLNFYGNHTVVGAPWIALPEGWVPDRCPGAEENRATEAGRGAQATAWCAEQVLERGYALATLYHGDVAPDRPEASGGAHFVFVSGRRGAALVGEQDPGAIALWAWGLSRAVDYLLTDSAIDGARIAVTGHSRNGKAALFAAAFDRRIALVAPCQSGCGGAAPSRSQSGESVRQLTSRFPHWFCRAFSRFSEGAPRLPFDQHCLIALVAPRPVLLCNAAEDRWANPEGQFEMLRAAAPVYGLFQGSAPSFESLAFQDDRLGYFLRPGKHEMIAEDWEAILAFADRHLRR
jgi:hypothetical protein